MSTSESLRLRRPSTLRSLQVGDLKVTFVPDGSVRLKPYGWLPGTTERDWAEHADHLDETGNLVAGIGGLLVEAGERALLIDAGVGPVHQPDDPADPLIGELRGGDLLDNLARLGRRPEDVEAVAFTHLHIDHIGWAWHPAAGGPAFPSAEYLFAEPEWAERHRTLDFGTPEEALTAMAPRVRTFGDGEEIFPGVRATFAPGHTAGHTAYTITSGGQRLLAFGDALHSPVQVRRPEWPAGSDLDRVESTVHRRRLVEELLRPDTIGFGIHFADVVFGRARDTAEGPVWEPVA
ncbi:MBL fold metallo-hydrolase [Nonomuraea sp. NPDC001831]|uniref:MBL fold metallo-hydrolase n=1 Tax=Nonomuraea sp. NPDC001831 TaxID=3364340 RepID=UPI003690286C